MPFTEPAGISKKVGTNAAPDLTQNETVNLTSATTATVAYNNGVITITDGETTTIYTLKDAQGNAVTAAKVWSDKAANGSASNTEITSASPLTLSSAETTYVITHTSQPIIH